MWRGMSAQGQDFLTVFKAGSQRGSGKASQRLFNRSSGAAFAAAPLGRAVFVDQLDKRR
jgi:hypothetical protein